MFDDEQKITKLLRHFWWCGGEGTGCRTNFCVWPVRVRGPGVVERIALV